MKDPYNSIKPTQSLNIAARVNGTQSGASVDRNGAGTVKSMYQAAVAVIHTGTITDGTHTFGMDESDDNAAWSAVAAADLQGSFPAAVAADSNKVFSVGYQGRKRFLRVTCVTTGATTGGIHGGQITLADPRVLPAA